MWERPSRNSPRANECKGTNPRGQRLDQQASDGRHIAYVARSGQKQVVIVDAQAGVEYDAIGKPLLFSPDGKRIAYAALKAGNWLVVVDGLEGGQYDGIGTMTFDPDGKRVAYGATKGGKWVVVVDRHEGAEYDGIAEGSPIFTPTANALRMEPGGTGGSLPWWTGRKVVNTTE